MRKRFVTTFFTCILSAVCALGFAACGEEDYEIPKGEEVTEEEWKAAIRAAYNIENYTLYHTLEAYGSTIKVTIYKNKDSYYQKEFGTQIYDDSEYTNEICSVVKENIIWVCSNGMYFHGDENWHADKQEFNDAVSAKEIMAAHNMNIEHWIVDEVGQFRETYESIYGNTEELLVNMYSNFTYADGKYTATYPCTSYDVTYSTDCPIEISFKDGKVIGFSVTSDDGARKRTVTCKNFGKTVVPMPKGALDAIKAAEAE